VGRLYFTPAHLFRPLFGQNIYGCVRMEELPSGGRTHLKLQSVPKNVR
jgi:hypothetical protein